MLTLDMIGLSEKELEKVVVDLCSRFGLVLGIKIMHPDDPRNDAVAAVEMSTDSEAHRLRNVCGDMEAGATVIMRLVQK